MIPKLHTPPEIQLLVNTVMSWAAAQLKTNGRIPAAAAWLPRNTSQPEFRTVQAGEDLSLEEQERLLAAELEGPWERHELAAILLAAPVLYGRPGSSERSEAVRLHVEAAPTFCVDILMPYRIRAASRWRGNSQNRVHFSHPVAQESNSFAPMSKSYADETQIQRRLHDLRRRGDV
jgi:hypothetical protein